VSIPSRTFLTVLLCLGAVFIAVLPAKAQDWLPISQEELKMTSEPKAPGAPAIYLYRQVDRDDNGPYEREYARIKILTEEGRSNATIEIRFLKGTEKVRDIEARTIHPDGTIVDFKGEIFEKTIVKAKGLKYVAKIFTMPDVRVGSIVEYRYRHDEEVGYVFDSHWILSEELFTKHAKFSLKPSADHVLRVSWPAGLPPGTNPPSKEHGEIRLETADVPAFQIEDYMPPEYVLQSRVDFIYITDPNAENDVDKFWKEEGRRWYRGVTTFVNEPKAMERAVSQIILPNDTPEAKLRKIYARTQQIRNLSVEREKSEKEAHREKLKPTRTVEDVWKYGYGSGMQITWLFLALARAAGFQADPLVVSTRDVYFFSPALKNPHQLNSNVVLVKLEGKDLYLDPGSAFTPFGLLPWGETRVQGLLLDKDGGNWITTTAPGPAESRVERRAKLHLTDSGSLEGKVTITFTGLEALWRRREELNEDDTARKKLLEDEIKEFVPVPAESELMNKPDWNTSALTLVAEYDLKVPSWASTAGHRTILPVGLFGGMEKHSFEHANRVHPVYFSFPYQNDDEVIIELPSGWKVDNTPEAQNIDLTGVAYTMVAESKNSSVHVKRHLMLNLETVETKDYPILRGFFQKVRTGDEQQIVVSHGTASAQN
jgi:hypothetical protein